VVQTQLAEEEDLVRVLETEKEIQAGGEVKELQATVDALSME
jgi:hypothetical protein